MILSMWLVVVYVDGLFQLHAHWTNLDKNRPTKTQLTKNVLESLSGPKRLATAPHMCEDSTTRLENLLFARCLLFGSLLFGPVFYDESAYTPKTGVMHEKL